MKKILILIIFIIAITVGCMITYIFLGNLKTDLDGVGFKNEYYKVIHDGNNHAIELEGELPKDLIVEYEYYLIENDNLLLINETEVKNIGLYKVVANLTHYTFYEPIDPMETYVEIIAGEVYFESKQETYDGSEFYIEAEFPILNYDVYYYETSNPEEKYTDPKMLSKKDSGDYEIAADFISKVETENYYGYKANLTINKAKLDVGDAHIVSESVNYEKNKRYMPKVEGVPNNLDYRFYYKKVDDSESALFNGWKACDDGIKDVGLLEVKAVIFDPLNDNYQGEEIISLVEILPGYIELPNIEEVYIREDMYSGNYLYPYIILDNRYLDVGYEIKLYVNGESVLRVLDSGIYKCDVTFFCEGERGRFNEVTYTDLIFVVEKYGVTLGEYQKNYYFDNLDETITIEQVDLEKNSAYYEPTFKIYGVRREVLEYSIDGYEENIFFFEGLGEIELKINIISKNYEFVEFNNLAYLKINPPLITDDLSTNGTYITRLDCAGKYKSSETIGDVHPDLTKFFGVTKWHPGTNTYICTNPNYGKIVITNFQTNKVYKDSHHIVTGGRCWKCGNYDQR
ncbi:MAG: hypothetical protein ACRC5M_04035 [Anaeroplasmataceae bacterium]